MTPEQFDKIVSAINATAHTSQPVPYEVQNALAALPTLAGFSASMVSTLCSIHAEIVLIRTFLQENLKEIRDANYWRMQAELANDKLTTYETTT